MNIYLIISLLVYSFVSEKTTLILVAQSTRSASNRKEEKNTEPSRGVAYTQQTANLNVWELTLRAYCFLMVGFIRLSQKVCSRLISEQGREYAEAYLFVRNLTILVKHPILFKFKANLTAIRLLTGFTDKRFRQLLNTALTYNLAYYEGSNLRLYSRSKELKQYRASDYQDIKIEDAKAFLQVSTLKYHAQQQIRAIKYKSSTLKKAQGSGEHLNLMRRPINYDVTLSYRKFAQLLNVSVSHAYKLAKELKAFGLTLLPNRVLISKQDFSYYRSINNWNAKIIDRQYYFIGANIVKFNSFYTPKPLKSPYYLSEYW